MAYGSLSFPDPCNLNYPNVESACVLHQVGLSLPKKIRALGTLLREIGMLSSSQHAEQTFKKLELLSAGPSQDE